MRAHRSGFIFIYGVIMMAALIGFVSLAVDFGRAEAAMTELHNAADAAARYAVTGLATSNATAIADAIAVAGQNTVDTGTLVLQNSDVVVGTWASGAFTAGGSSPNAVQVTAHRTAARGTAIPLVFGQIIGMPTCDVTVTSTAYIIPATSTYGIVGLSSFMMRSSTLVDSYDSTSDPTYQHPGTSGSIASNGGYTFTTVSTVDGNVNYYGSAPSGATLTGSYDSMSSQISDSQAAMPGTYTSLGNINMTGTQNWNLSAGNYYLTNLQISSGTVTITASGPVVIYLNGNFSLNSATLTTSGNLPPNLTINMEAGAGMNVTGGIYGTLNGPNSPLNLNNNSVIFGSVISSQITMNSGSAIHYDTALGGNGGGSGGGTISIVK